MNPYQQQLKARRKCLDAMLALNKSANTSGVEDTATKEVLAMFLWECGVKVAVEEWLEKPVENS